MARKSSNKVKKYVALSILLTSIIIAIIGFYLVLVSLGNGSASSITYALAALMALLILLILSMMLRIVVSLRKRPLEEEELL